MGLLRSPRYCSAMGSKSPLCPICHRVRHANTCADKADGELNPKTQCAYQESKECLEWAKFHSRGSQK